MQAHNDLFERFSRRLDPACRVAFSNPSDIDRALRAALDEAGRLWPAIHLAPTEFIDYLVPRLEEQTPDCLASLHLTDLHLACACAQAQPAALHAFEAAFFPEIGQALIRSRAMEVTAADFSQRLRQELFVPRASAPPKITEYSGRGRLRNWFRVVVVRTLINLRRYQPGRLEIPVSDSLLQDLSPGDGDPELAYLKKLYRVQFANAVERAVAALDPRQRNLLRFHLVDRLGIDQIGTLFHVHRATAARWLGKAREQLLQVIRAELRSLLRVDQSEFDSILRLIQSQIDVRLSRVLEATDSSSQP
jgi:RNA polymerase sigma-70 factor (ECF subfamily)